MKTVSFYIEPDVGFHENRRLLVRTNKEVCPDFSARFSRSCVPYVTFESLLHKSTGP